MGVVFKQLNCYYEYDKNHRAAEQPLQVFNLAVKVVEPIIDSGLSKSCSHIVLATTCPDALAPSLGQMIVETFHDQLGNCHIFDLVQGCAGGVSALILGSQLAEMHQTSVLVIQVDAAQKAASAQKEISQIFGNGCFACVVSYEENEKKLMHTQSRQYKGLSQVVTVNVGHDADLLIQSNLEMMAKDPRFFLGLSMDNSMAIQLLKNAEQFYVDFINASQPADVMILHQVNPVILSHLKSVFQKYPLLFIDVSAQTGNCGAASTGIALCLNQEAVQGKKVLLCSFGTGGVITAGMWQM